MPAFQTLGLPRKVQKATRRMRALRIPNLVQWRRGPVRQQYCRRSGQIFNQAASSVSGLKLVAFLFGASVFSVASRAVHCDENHKNRIGIPQSE